MSGHQCSVALALLLYQCISRVALVKSLFRRIRGRKAKYRGSVMKCLKINFASPALRLISVISVTLWLVFQAPLDICFVISSRRHTTRRLLPNHKSFLSPTSLYLALVVNPRSNCWRLTGDPLVERHLFGKASSGLRSPSTVRPFFNTSLLNPQYVVSWCGGRFAGVQIS